MDASIFWYDYETTGVSPRSDRPLQVAGIRTDEALNEIDEPLNLYCRLSDDILPHPAACLVTGITPEVLDQQGLKEIDFVQQLHGEMMRPRTCVAGYNSLRFDDEVTRYTFYRNFHDPYAREWQGGSSRWDLIDLVRTAYALRPEGIEWPRDEQGAVTLRLERLTAANGIAHGQAHDALSDVRATIALARLIRERQPRLYDYLYDLRQKHRVRDAIQLMKPVVHVSGRYAGSRHYLAVVLPLAWHPQNRNALIVCDLQADPAPLLTKDAATLRQHLYTRHEALLASGELPVPLKLVQINRCPVLAPLSVLGDGDLQRLGIDMSRLQERRALLEDAAPEWQPKLKAIYEQENASGETTDAEQQLYEGFIADSDRRVCERVRRASAETVSADGRGLNDPRLVELLFRFRARNYPESLNDAERAQWYQFCRQRLSESAQGAPRTMSEFTTALHESMATASAAQQALLEKWRAYAVQLAGRYSL